MLDVDPIELARRARVSARLSESSPYEFVNRTANLGALTSSQVRAIHREIQNSESAVHAATPAGVSQCGVGITDRKTQLSAYGSRVTCKACRASWTEQTRLRIEQIEREEADAVR